ncbi:MAG: copper resistance protein CopC/CopD [Nitrosopumilaceae archaeon]|nr:copper resistance protein CopC/CopD [Nitrosopumilaceae archaeon]
MRPLVLVSVLVLTAAAAPAAHAHPFTLETWPGGGVNGEVGTTQVWVRYSEEVELRFSSLKVYDGAGNQIDGRNTAYHIGEASLAVSTPPLEEGVYTVASKVLSRVDGHLVPDTFVFAVGDIVLEQGPDDTSEELVYLPEAAARFPGLAGQTILLGSAIAALLVWNDRYRRRVGDGAEAASAAHRSRLTGVMGASLIAVLASNIAMLAVQTVRLGAFSPETLETHFGLMWIIRMIITGALLALWFATERRGIGGRTTLAIIGLAAILLWTSSQIGHGAATGDPLAVMLDYIHNWVAAVWIGGVAYLCLILVPALSAAGGRDRAVAVMLPRFSAVFTVCLGIVIVTGPLLMWTLESDLPAITESVYGRLIMAKLALASGMVAMGGYMQLSIMRPEGWKGAWGRLRRGLRAELAMGVALLGVVALLINGTLPAGEVRAGEAARVHREHKVQHRRPAVHHRPQRHIRDGRRAGRRPAAGPERHPCQGLQPCPEHIPRARGAAAYGDCRWRPRVLRGGDLRVRRGVDTGGGVAEGYGGQRGRDGPAAGGRRPRVVAGTDG